MADENKETTGQDAVSSNPPQQNAVPTGAPVTGAPVVVPQPLVTPPPPVRDEIAESVGIVLPKPRAEATIPAPSLTNDIAKILQEVKLPDRRTSEREGNAAPTAHEISPVLNTAAEAPVTPPAVPSAAPETPKVPGETPISTVHTLKQDLQNVVREQKISVVRAAALEQDKRRPAEFETTSVEKANTSSVRGLVFAIVLLAILGFAALAGVLFVMKSMSNAPQQRSDSLVFAEQSFPFPLQNQSSISLKAALAQTRTGAGGALGSISRIVPTVPTHAPGDEAQERIATFAEFTTAIAARPPAELIRALDDNFFFGIHTVDENAPLIVIPVASYDRAFAAMLAWEKNMNADLAPLFTGVPTLTMGTDGIATERLFSDIVMRNYDVRALKDDGGTIQLYYSFPTRDLLVIAESPYTFTELLSRLQAERRL